MAAPSLLDKWLFMDAIVRASGLSDLDRRIAFRLLSYFDEERGGAWPALDTLAGELSVTKRACIDSVKRLEAAGWFTCIHSRGRGRSNLYRPVWEKVNHASPIEAEKVKPASPITAVKGEVSRQEKVKPTSPDSVYRTRLGSIDSPTLFPDDGKVISLPKAKAPTKPAKPAFPEEAFAEFWTVYPRKVDQDATRGAYREALKKGATPAGLIASASTYAAAVAQEDTPTKFIKKPANFLRHGAWKNAPEDQSPHTAGNSSPCRQSIQDAASRVFADTPEARAFREAL